MGIQPAFEAVERYSDVMRACGKSSKAPHTVRANNMPPSSLAEFSSPSGASPVKKQKQGGKHTLNVSSASADRFGASKPKLLWQTVWGEYV